jgi:4'-phosphopantetheinyl transferase
MVEVYATNLDVEWINRHYHYLLSKAPITKQAHLAQLHQEDRRRSLLGEGLLHYVISLHTGIKSEELVFSYGPNGKPYLAAHHQLHFNLSHSGSYCVCAIHTQPVGIDIEQVTPMDILSFREHLSTTEYYELRSLPAKEQLSHFYQLWTLKESYLKQTGFGLSIPMGSFSLHQNKGTYQILDALGRPLESIYFKQYTVHDGYKMAVCATINSFTDIQFIPLPQIIP